jgi:hypothetical protein
MLLNAKLSSFSPEQVIKLPCCVAKKLFNCLTGCVFQTRLAFFKPDLPFKSRRPCEPINAQ